MPQSLKDPWKRVASSSMLIAAASLVVMVVFVVSNNRAITDITDARNEARITACFAFNVDVVANVNGLNDRTQELLDQTFNAPRETPRIPELQAQIDEFLAHQKSLYEAVKIPERDCSPQGITDYYERGR